MVSITLVSYSHSSLNTGSVFSKRNFTGFFFINIGYVFINPMAHGQEGRKEGNVLFNDALNTFYLRLYGIGQLVKDRFT